ncbi:MAG: YihA family ribosome biogenesis GTP-binding protein [Alphaproteobacteria bacterium]|nr:YihA family ribosome biogenesis GTP-binding protein [Alphaproteobacteria bacterium]
MSDKEEELKIKKQQFGHWLFEQDCEFLIGAVKCEQVPDFKLTEIAFAGRSNVGKSSLINALTRRKTVARTSNTPGRTQQLNFFKLASRIILVDLPGYGYAQAPKNLVKQWTRLVFDYLKGRPVLRRVCLLIDARRGLKDNDFEAMEILDEAAVNYQVILTKADKLKKEPLEALVKKIAKQISKHAAAYPDIIITSSHKGIGIEELRTVLASTVMTKEEKEIQ